MTVNTANEALAIQKLRQWDAMCTYRTIEDADAFIKKELPKLKHYTEVAFDTEATGLDVIGDSVLGYSFAFEPYVAWWVPIETDPQMRILKAALKGRTAILANAAYDLPMVKRHGVRVKKFQDVLIGCFFADVNSYRLNPGLKGQAEMRIGLPTVELKEIIAANTGKEKIKRDEVDFTMLEPWQQRVYGCQDADITMRLWREKSIQDAVRRMPDIWYLEHEVIPAVIEMKNNGITVDVAKCEELDKKLEAACDACTKRVEELCIEQGFARREGDRIVFNVPDRPADYPEGEETPHEKMARLTKKTGINLGSFIQKQILLFDLIGMPKTRAVKSGYSTESDELQLFVGDYPIVKQIVLYNQYVARRNAYTKKIPGMLNRVTGRLHPTLWSFGVKSGRFSCSDPNMQGISTDNADDDVAKIRDMFIAPKGDVLIAADFSQIELRIAAVLSEEPTLLDAYDAKEDLHSYMARRMYGVPSGKAPETWQRYNAKRANFSVLTGTGAHTLYLRAAGAIESVKAAQDIIDRWWEQVPNLNKWAHVKVPHWLRTQGWIATYFGRIRPFPEFHKPSEALIAHRMNDFMERDWAADYTEMEIRDIAIRSIQNGFMRKALSHIIQGTAADVMKIRLVKTQRAIRKSKLPIKILLQVHDELLFQCPRRVANKAKKLIVETMTWPQFGKETYERTVDLLVDAKIGHTWSDAH